MSVATPSVVEADAQRAAAKQQLFATLGEAQARLNPKTLAQNAVENVASNVMTTTATTVRTRPGAVAAAVGAVTLFLARKPIGRLLRSDSGSDRDDATGEQLTSLKAKENAAHGGRKDGSDDAGDRGTERHDEPAPAGERRDRE